MTLAALDFEQAKAASLLYQAGDSAYRSDSPAQGIFDAACDALFEGHGYGSYAAYNGKNLEAWPNPIVDSFTFGDWTIRQYRNRIFDAVPTDHTSFVISPAFDSVAEVKAWLADPYGEAGQDTTGRRG